MSVDIYYSSSLACISLLIFLYGIIKYKKVYRGNQFLNSNYKSIFFFLTLYSVFAFAEADTYHYQELYEELYKAQIPWHVEPVHFWIIKHVPHNYYVWRIFVWGISAILYIYSFKRFGIQANVIGYVLTIMMLVPFAQTRGTLGFSLMMFALAYYVPLKIKNISRYLLFILLIVLSTFFHKSLGIYALLYPLAILIPYNKKSITLSLLCFPILYLAVYTMSNYILELDFLGEQTVDRGLSYLERGTEGEYNIYGLLTNSILWIALLLCFYETTKFYLNSCHNITIISIQKYAYILVYVSFLFYGQNISNFLFTRTLNFAMFPLAISFAYYLQNSTRNYIAKVAMFFFLLNTLYEITYHIYKFN